MRVSKIIMAVAMIFFCSSVQTYGSEPLKNKSIAVIEPRIGIGNIKLGDNLQVVIKKMGIKPSDGKAVRSGDLREYWMSYTDMGITFIFDERQTLTRIAVSNPSINLEKINIRVNSSVKELMTLYGHGEILSISDKYEQWSYKDKGISFTINKNTSKIETITIEKSSKK